MIVADGAMVVMITVMAAVARLRSRLSELETFLRTSRFMSLLACS